MVLQSGNRYVHPLLPFWKFGSSSIKYLWLIVFVDFIIFPLKLLKLTRVEIMNALILRFDISNSKLGPESNSRLQSKMAKFSYTLLERDRRQRIFNQDYFKLSQQINLKCVINTVENFIGFQDNSSNFMWTDLILAFSSKTFFSMESIMDCIVHASKEYGR